MRSKTEGHALNLLGILVECMRLRDYLPAALYGFAIGAILGGIATYRPFERTYDALRGEYKVEEIRVAALKEAVNVKWDIDSPLERAVRFATLIYDVRQELEYVEDVYGRLPPVQTLTHRFNEWETTAYKALRDGLTREETDALASGLSSMLTQAELELRDYGSQQRDSAFLNPYVLFLLGIGGGTLGVLYRIGAHQPNDY